MKGFVLLIPLMLCVLLFGDVKLGGAVRGWVGKGGGVYEGGGGVIEGGGDSMKVALCLGEFMNSGEGEEVRRVPDPQYDPLYDCDITELWSCDGDVMAVIDVDIPAKKLLLL